MKKILLTSLILVYSITLTAQTQYDLSPGNKNIDFQKSLIINTGGEGIGYNLMAEEKYNKAIRYFKKEIKKQEEKSKNSYKDPFPYYFTGICYAELQKEDSAKHYFRKTLKADSLFTDVYQAYSLLYLQKREFDKSLKYMEKALKYNKGSLIITYNLAHINFLLNNVQKSVNLFKKVAARNPKFKNVYITLGKIYYYSENDEDSALYYYSKAVDADPLNPIPYIQRGHFYYEERENQKAYKDLKKVIDINPDAGDAYRLLALIDLRKDSLRKAAKKTSKVVKLNWQLTNEFEKNSYHLFNTYRISEFLSILSDIQVNDLTKAEKRLSKKFLKSWAKNNFSEGFDNAENFQFFHPNSILGQRIYVYSLFLDLPFSRNSIKYEKEIDKLLSMDSTIYTPMYIEAYKQIYFNRDKRAIQSLKKILQKQLLNHLEYESLYYNMVKLYLENKQYKTASRLLDSTLEFNESKDFYTKIASAKTSRGEYRKAIKYLLKASKKEETEKILNDIALNYLNLINPDSTIFYCNKVIEKIDPYSTQAHINRAVAYQYQNKYKKALADFNLVIESDPMNNSYRKKRAKLLFEMGRYEKAVYDYSICIKKNKENKTLYHNRGKAYYNNNKFDLALKDFKSAIKIDSTLFKAHAYMGKCLFRLKKYDKAKEALKKSLEINPSYIHALDILSRVYYFLEEFNKSIEYSNKIINLDENAFYAGYKIALAKLRMGKFDEAKALYRRYSKKEKNHRKAINKKAILDLQLLIKQGIHVSESLSIINNILKSYQ
jgi:tetratricopeptide (TPR) repeat protein